MTTTMGPPPPQNTNKNPEPDPNSRGEEPSASSKASPMGPPPPKNPNPVYLEAPHVESDDGSLAGDGTTPVHVQEMKQSSVPYSIPEWSGPPSHRFQLEVLKDGSIVDQFDVCEKGAYLFGRADICDFVLEHPTISRFHTVLQFKRSGDAYIFDLGSTHGTFVNKNQVDKRVYVDLHVGDVIRFGCSTRLYIFQGPSELMPPEKDLNLFREAKSRQEMLDREASLRRARREASMADGISWGIGEDAVEEVEEDVDEITWQTYKGQLTEKQEKTREKVLKRMEKINHMKKEIAAIRAKDISQGGLTQGQQTQIARNEQRITQLLEELENLEETLNDSIRESLSARAGKITCGKKKGQMEEDEEFSSEEDEFYDRTKKKASTQESSEGQAVETADTLLEKRESIMKKIEEKKELLLAEKNKMNTETATDPEPGDSLDAYMTGLSSQLVRDKASQLEQELSVLQSELDRIEFLLKIADPTGEAVKKRVLKSQEPKPNKSEKPKKPPLMEQKDRVAEKPENVSEQKEETAEVSVDSNSKPAAENTVGETAEGKAVVYTVTKPQWLGAVADREAKEETRHGNDAVDTNEPDDEFVDYKDREKILTNAEAGKVKPCSGIESAAPGLIIRKRKQKDEGEEIEKGDKSEPKQAEVMAQDAVALLLRYSRGYHEDEDKGISRTEEKQDQDHSNKKKKKKKKKEEEEKGKKVLGPEKPAFLDDNTDCDPWVPPQGQSGDGRTSLNDRYGY